MDTAAGHTVVADVRALDPDFEVLRELGRGTMGVVLLARRRDSGRLVAIKIVHPSAGDSRDAEARIQREAQTVGRMRHPNIVRHDEMRRLPNGGLALVMQYVAGETLASVLRRTPRLAPEIAANVLRDVALALQYAHEQHVVHRDVKPANIFIYPDTGSALLSDFGIAKSFDGDDDITLAGFAIGTPTYMSPEQLDGQLPVDGRSDLYSLGIVGWEMLSGIRPWLGEGLYGIIYKQKYQDLPRLAAIRSDVPPRLVHALDGVLDKDPALRFATAAEFLEQLAQDEPTAATRRRHAARGTSPALAVSQSDHEPTATIEFRPVVPAPPPTVAAAVMPMMPPTTASATPTDAPAAAATPIADRITEPAPESRIDSAPEPVVDRLADLASAVEPEPAAGSAAAEIVDVAAPRPPAAPAATPIAEVPTAPAVEAAAEPTVVPFAALSETSPEEPIAEPSTTPRDSGGFDGLSDALAEALRRALPEPPRAAPPLVPPPVAPPFVASPLAAAAPLPITPLSSPPPALEGDAPSRSAPNGGAPHATSEVGPMPASPALRATANAAPTVPPLSVLRPAPAAATPAVPIPTPITVARPAAATEPAPAVRRTSLGIDELREHAAAHKPATAPPKSRWTRRPATIAAVAAALLAAMGLGARALTRRDRQVAQRQSAPVMRAPGVPSATATDSTAPSPAPSGVASSVTAAPALAPAPSLPAAGVTPPKPDQASLALAAAGAAGHYAAGHRAAKPASVPATTAVVPAPAQTAQPTPAGTTPSTTTASPSVASHDTVPPTTSSATATQTATSEAPPSVAPVVVTEPAAKGVEAGAAIAQPTPASAARAAARKPVMPDAGAAALASAERLLAARDFRQARAAADSAIGISPRVPGAYAVRARVRLQQGEIREAWADAEMAARLGDFWAAQTATAIVEHRAGDTTSARSRVETLVKIATDGRHTLDASDEVELAMALSALGDRPRALAALERVKPADYSAMRVALGDPTFDALRGDSRFQVLVQRSQQSVSATRGSARGRS